MKKIFILFTAILLLSACKHDVNIAITDENSTPVVGANVSVTKQDIPAIHKYISAYEAEVGKTAFMSTGMDIGIDTAIVTHKANEWYESIGKLFPEMELNKFYLDFLDVKENVKWVANDVLTDDNGEIKTKLKRGRHNILIEKDGFIKSYIFHTFNKNDRKSFVIKTE
jgi:hypothetical protein